MRNNFDRGLDIADYSISGPAGTPAEAKTGSLQSDAGVGSVIL